MSARRTIVLGGGLSGLGVAYSLARGGAKDVTVLEGGASLGGLAGSFEREGRFYPLGYHHILHRDRTLLYFLREIGVFDAVRWRRIRMLFRHGDRLDSPGTPLGFLRFPMSLTDKLRFVRLMLRAYRKSDWSDWIGRSASDLVDAWAGPGVRQAMFEPLTQLRFELSSAEISAAWLGARLHFREGSAPLGYMPHANWTKILCDGMTRLVESLGVECRTRTPIASLRTEGGRVVAAVLESGESISGDRFVSTLPTETFAAIVPPDETPGIREVHYTALLSAIFTTRQPVSPDFYWINLDPGRTTATGVFRLSSLNPTIGAPGETCLNLVTHLRDRHRPLFQLSNDELVDRYRSDFAQIFGQPLCDSWFHVARVGMYAPIFDVRYSNPPPRSSTFANLWFAGNYRTYPSIMSTGTALSSGIEVGERLLAEDGIESNLSRRVAAFRLNAMPREDA